MAKQEYQRNAASTQNRGLHQDIDFQKVGNFGQKSTTHDLSHDRASFSFLQLRRAPAPRTATQSMNKHKKHNSKMHTRANKHTSTYYGTAQIRKLTLKWHSNGDIIGLDEETQEFFVAQSHKCKTNHWECMTLETAPTTFSRATRWKKYSFIDR